MKSLKKRKASKVTFKEHHKDTPFPKDAERGRAIGNAKYKDLIR